MWISKFILINALSPVFHRKFFLILKIPHLIKKRAKINGSKIVSKAFNNFFILLFQIIYKKKKLKEKINLINK